MKNLQLKRLIANGKKAIRHVTKSDKEVKRFTEIYMTVYTHARKKGQTHKMALNYCHNVYQMYAPKNLSKTIKYEQDKIMTLHDKSLKEMIRQELMSMIEGDVVDFNAYKQQTPESQPIQADPEAAPAAEFETFLSEIHSQIIDFMEDNFESLDAEKQGFLDDILDTIEDRLGMEDEEGFDVASFEDEDEDEEL